MHIRLTLGDRSIPSSISPPTLPYKYKYALVHIIYKKKIACIIKKNLIYSFDLSISFFYLAGVLPRVTSRRYIWLFTLYTYTSPSSLRLLPNCRFRTMRYGNIYQISFPENKSLFLFMCASEHPFPIYEETVDETTATTTPTTTLSIGKHTVCRRVPSAISTSFQEICYYVIDFLFLLRDYIRLLCVRV